MQCANPGEGLSVTCSAAPPPLSPPPTQPLNPALPNPAGNLGFQVQGVPSEREYAAESMTWDGADGYVLLFGGSNYTGTYEGDTWTYLHGVWTELSPPISPTGRDSTGLVYDATDNYVLLFGGYTPGSGGVLNDTWSFSDGIWTYNAYASTHGPSPRNSFDIAYDAATDYVILFGGHAAPCNGNYTYQDCNDTWMYWYGGWTQLHPARPPPPAREQSAMVYDAADGYPLLFGGYGPKGIVNASHALGDTWFWNATGYGKVGNWTQVKTGGVYCGTQAEGKCGATAAPSERWQIQLGYDVADHEVVLFGGFNNSAGTFSDTWTYSAGVWTKLSPTTSAWGRWGGAIAFDSTDNYLLMWGGGYIYNTPVDGVWKFVAGNWSEVAPGTGPPGVYAPAMAYDAVDGYVVFFGGESSLTGLLDQTWLYNSGVWTQDPLTSAQQPPARAFASVTWDAAHGYVLLFGGEGVVRVPERHLGICSWFVDGIVRRVHPQVCPVDPLRCRPCLRCDGRDADPVRRVQPIPHRGERYLDVERQLLEARPVHACSFPSGVSRHDVRCRGPGDRRVRGVERHRFSRRHVDARERERRMARGRYLRRTRTTGLHRFTPEPAVPTPLRIRWRRPSGVGSGRPLRGLGGIL